MNRPFRAVLLAGISFGLTNLSPAKEPPTAAKLDALLEVIKPQPDEDRWAKIAWRADLWAARREAAEKGKPILLWEMDGNPLGCT